MPNAARAGLPRPYLYGFAIATILYGWLSVNTYLPVLPKLESALDTTPHAARQTVTAFLVAFAVTQLVWGPVSDRFGRKPVLLAGLSIAAVCATLAGLSPDIYMFTGARILEGIGMGAAPVLARSMLTDTLDRVHIAIAISYVIVVVALSPAFAPVMGGYIALVLSWRAIFFFLALYGVALFVFCLFRIPETHRRKGRARNIADVAVGYLELFRDRRFTGYLVIYSAAYGIPIGYYVAASFIFTRELGYDPHQYGFLLFFNAVFYVIGATAARFAVPKFGTDRVIAFAIAAHVTAVVLLFVLDRVTGLSTVGVLLPMSVFIFGSGLVSPPSNAGMMSLFREKAGAVAAVIGAATSLSGAIMNAGLSTVRITQLWELGAYVAVGTAIGLVSYRLLLRSSAARGRRRS